MKKFIVLCLAALMGIGMVSAAEKKPVKKELKTVVFCTDIHCGHCAQKIMDNVPVLGKGVKDVQVDLPNKEVTVVFDSSKNNEEHLIHALSTLKVNAEVKAEKQKK